MDKMMGRKALRRGCVAAAIAASLLPAAVYAQENPFAGVGVAGYLLNELEPERHIDPNPPKPDVKIEAPALSQQGTEEAVEVEKIAFHWAEADLLAKKPALYYKPEGKTELQHLDEEAHLLADGKIGGKITFNNLVKLAEEITLRLRQLGYPTAICYMPRQQMAGGVLTMNVILGTYDGITLTNESMLTDERLKGYTYELKAGDLIYNDTINKSLLILNEIPGMLVRANMAPGSAVGTAGLVIDASCLEKQGAMAYVDNYGSRSTGRYRYGAHYHYNNLSRVGDQIQLNYMTSNHRDIDNYHIQYDLPLGRDGAKWRVGYSRMNYELGDKHAWMDADGMSDTFETGVTIPMERTLNYSNFYDIAYRHRQIEDNMFGKVFSEQKSSDVVDITLKGYKRASVDSLSYSITTSIGKLYMDNEQAQTTDMYGAAGWFQKTGADAYYIHNFSDVTSLHVSASGQWSWGHDLDSSEDFYISGPNAVRAYPSGEASGDWGALGTAELRYQTDCPELQLTAFYDVGYVRYNTNPIISGERSQTLAGAGIGLIYNKSRDYYFKLDYAVPLTDKYSRSFGRDNDHMLWFRFVKQF